jgi:succinate dehydrogenase / fumarate reductase cytochrome b subunit
MGDSYLRRFLRSTLGLKVLMGVTGLILFGFLIGHVSGNLLAFAGQSPSGRFKLDDYAVWLREHPGLLWGTRVTLLICVAVHIVTTIRLAKLRGDARPIPYEAKEPHGTTYAARTMFWTGPIVALFVVYHLLHFTWGTVHPDFKHLEVQHNVVRGFQSPLAISIYVVGMLAILLHLAHGIWSVTQTLGVNRPNLEPGLKRVAVLISVLIVGGFLSVPFGVLSGLIRWS